MLAILICILALVSSYLLGRRSLWLGLFCVVAWGYFYGILRANILSAGAHFIFDCALLGLYSSQLFQHSKASQSSADSLKTWIITLIAWPCLLLVLPFQDFLVSVVGLRGNVFFLPICLVGAYLTSRDSDRFALALACLNLVAAVFAFAEFTIGIERFFPISPVTAIIYASRDVSGFEYYRLPAIFANAHSYAGTMVMTLPFIMGAWLAPQRTVREKLLLFGGIGAAVFGILVANARTHMVVGAVVLTIFLFLMRGRGAAWYRLAWCLVAGAVLYSVLTSERFGSRVTTLADTDYVMERLQGSVNRTFLEVLIEYPMGNGLGGGGTSMPYFLAGQVHSPIAIESEYARILLEQGVVGLALWIAFIVWFLSRSVAVMRTGDSGKRIAWVACALYLLVGMTGLGMLTSIPQSVLMLLAMGSVLAPTEQEAAPGMASASARRRLPTYA